VGLLEIATGQPAAEAFGTDRPRFPVAVDIQIGKAGAVRCVKQRSHLPQFDQDIGRRRVAPAPAAVISDDGVIEFRHPAAGFLQLRPQSLECVANIHTFHLLLRVPRQSSPLSQYNPQRKLRPLSPPAYAEGRQARIEYERWFAALPPAGDYRDGASFWASHRSLRPQPKCRYAGWPAWEAVCNDSRARLTPAGLRRKTEPNYWWGWNTL
jgi:hypothetical protein